MKQPPVLISEQDIQARVAELAAQISADYSDKGDIVLVGVLKGAFIFLADLARHLTIPLVDRFEFRSDIDPDLLMYALYYRTFLADPSDEPPDLGPLAGYSPLRRDEHKVQGLAGDPSRRSGTGAPLKPWV